MCEEQLEFIFIKDLDQIKNKKGIIDWTVEHVRPDLGWDVKPGHEDDDEKLGFGNFVQQVKEHLRLGILFKWKF